jgi:division/cell wall cluster transcriptional repressor MraZ
MLSGKYERKLDYKGRLTIPDDLLVASDQDWGRVVALSQRADIEQDTFFLSLYDLGTWKTILGAAFTNLSEDQGRVFMDRVVGAAVILDLDATKRVTIPGPILRNAGIERATIVTGIFDHIEVWDQVAYATYLEAVGEWTTVPSIADLARTRIREVS